MPQFLGGLWQRNQFTYYNIDDATQLINTGQYSQAVTVLTPAISFLQQIGNTKRATDAQQLLSKARAGVGESPGWDFDAKSVQCFVDALDDVVVHTATPESN